MIEVLSFYLLVGLAQREGIRSEGFGNFAECMEAKATWESENDDLLVTSRCDEIRLFPVGSTPPKTEEESRNGVGHRD